ncbi:MAG TPA: fumarylacetoacetate hydrolase family protein [Chloroflexota bacterium]|nr:fumarylacetoacetate hydrolase family protein [Chloroflexota bacterium]
MSASSDPKDLAKRLFEAQHEHRPIPLLTNEGPIGEKEAYAIQWALVEEHIARGGKVIGKKTGLTSKAKQVQMNTSEPLYAYLIDRTILNDGAEIVRAEHIHPRVECEIAFVMGRQLHGPGVTGDQVLSATRHVLPALEVIDSRYDNFKFTLPDVIADQASAAKVVLGGKVRSPKGLDLRLLGMVLQINGEDVATGSGAAVLGHPADSVAWLVNKMAEMGAGGLEEGDLVMAGGLVEAFAVEPGDHLRAEFDHLGPVSLKCV